MSHRSLAAFHDHDHAHCTGAGLDRADALAQSRGLRLTPVRRATLEILLSRHKAFGAYEILDELKQAGFGSQPPVAYRALDFLVEQGLAHRVRRLNAFMACTHPGTDHAPAFFICTECAAVAELPEESLRAAVGDAATSIGFEVQRLSVEAEGLCPNCKADE